jgi:hypothetical protein
MFMHNQGTKELVDALIICRHVMSGLQVQPIHHCAGFSDTGQLAQHLDSLIHSAEGGTTKFNRGNLS